MSEDRGMMKWAAYRSLVEQATYLKKMAYEKNKVEKPKIANEQAEEINEILTNYAGEEVVLTYWNDGYLYEARGSILFIDAIFKKLRINSLTVPFKELIRLERA